MQGPHLRSVRVGAVTALVVAGCQAAPPARQQSASAQVAASAIANVGLDGPESVLYDGVDDVYLVSNIKGQPLTKDDDGFISRIAPDGRVLQLKWIDGASRGVTLNAPKGMGL